MNLPIKTLPATAGFRRLLTRWIRRHPSQATSSNTSGLTSGKVVAIGFDGSRTSDTAVLSWMHEDGTMHFVTPKHIELLALQRREADHIAAYDEWIRHQRYRGRIHVLNLADDAWARYGWARPKVARRGQHPAHTSQEK